MTRQSFNEMMRDKMHREAQYSESMVKIAILRVFILEDWSRGMLLFTALNDIKDDSCSEIRDKLSAHGHICRFCQLEAFLWRGKHILTWDVATFTAYDDPQFKLPDPGLIYPVDNWSI